MPNGEERTFEVKINGKPKGEFVASWKSSREELIAHARSLEPIRGALHDREPRRVIIVPGRIVNFVM